MNQTVSVIFSVFSFSAVPRFDFVFPFFSVGVGHSYHVFFLLYDKKHECSE